MRAAMGFGDDENLQITEHASIVDPEKRASLISLDLRIASNVAAFLAQLTPAADEEFEKTLPPSVLKHAAADQVYGVLARKYRHSQRCLIRSNIDALQAHQVFLRQAERLILSQTV